MMDDALVQPTAAKGGGYVFLSLVNFKFESIAKKVSEMIREGIPEEVLAILKGFLLDQSVLPGQRCWTTGETSVRQKRTKEVDGLQRATLIPMFIPTLPGTYQEPEH